MKYRKKPVVIDAVQWTGDNCLEVAVFTSHGTREMAINHDEKTLIIKTLEGDMTASLNDFIIRGIQGEHYPCKPDIFHATYERV